MANLYFIVPVLLLAFFMQDGEPMLCWSCSSDLHSFCNDTFEASQDSHGSYISHLVNCEAASGAIYPYLTLSKSACMKRKTNINGLVSITRGCTWKRTDDYSSSCPTSTNGAHVSTLFCETCDSDGCNGV